MMNAKQHNLNPVERTFCASLFGGARPGVAAKADPAAGVAYRPSGQWSGNDTMPASRGHGIPVMHSPVHG